MKERESSLIAADLMQNELDEDSSRRTAGFLFKNDEGFSSPTYFLKLIS